ncbi:IS630 family transposase domain protein [Rickettsiales endosymbiont of Paramecium tredecaurelia]|uniref:transposase n=1 Tax=Candidatus Sarmatiella mevalonica TaxID=2770581 RepID=UPI001FC887DD|nr:transposase [Candidatus Sarmatiella mevalonica]MBL3284310.1 IS630 family transposase domain protein [Candidatus Sarmatiella mevalonica]
MPPYSPALNPIEKFWANMKRWIKNQITEFNQLYEAISYFFKIPNSPIGYCLNFFLSAKVDISFLGNTEQP